MKKCNLTMEELKENVFTNMNACYDRYKDKVMDMFPDEIWEECYEISLCRSLYTYMLYRIPLLTKNELKYLQKEDMFDELKTNFYKGEYLSHYKDFDKLVDNYIKNEKKLDMDGGME